MGILKGNINPLNVLGIRKLNFIPKHFSSITISSDRDIEKIEEWVYANLNSRYCIKCVQFIDDKNKISSIYKFGVEEEKELTIFSLLCPY